jgi:hypothetical protein
MIGCGLYYIGDMDFQVLDWENKAFHFDNGMGIWES